METDLSLLKVKCPLLCVLINRKKYKGMKGNVRKFWKTILKRNLKVRECSKYEKMRRKRGEKEEMRKKDYEGEHWGRKGEGMRRKGGGMRRKGEVEKEER